MIAHCFRPSPALFLFLIFGINDVLALEKKAKRLLKGRTVKISNDTEVLDVVADGVMECGLECGKTVPCGAFTYDHATKQCTVISPDSSQPAETTTDSIETRQTYIITNDVDDCKPNPCENGGSCVDKFFGFKCLCRPKFFGETCQLRRIPFQWVPAASSDCESTCQAESSVAAFSGVHGAGAHATYKICAVNVENQGYRTGVNIHPERDGCIVGYDGKELIYPSGGQFVCLCGNSTLEWVQAVGAETCSTTCSSESPDLLAFRSDWDQPLFVCGCNEGNIGRRPGFEQTGVQNNKCHVTWAKIQWTCTAPKMCLCY